MYASQPVLICEANKLVKFKYDIYSHIDKDKKMALTKTESY